eukprot:jgi/Chrzof1/11532/UNPLg00466.t1
MTTSSNCHLQQVLASATDRLVQQLQQQGYSRVAVLRTSLSIGMQTGWVQCSNDQNEQIPATGDMHGSGTGDSDGHGIPCTATKVLEYNLGNLWCPHVVARELFTALRAADAAHADMIVVEGVFDEGEGAAVMNRLRKAATKVVQPTGQ